MLSLSHQFLAFCRSKPADETFNPWSGDECAGYQFLRGIGAPVRNCWVTEWTANDGTWHTLPQPIASVIDWACGHQEQTGELPTFSALADRLEEALVGRGM